MNFLSIEAVSKSYSQHKALQDITFIVPRQSILGLLGPNGAGKTTLIRIITQIIAQDSGMVYLNDTPVKPADIRRIGYLPEERGLYKNMKVGEQLMFLAQLKGMAKDKSREAIGYWLENLNAIDWWNKPIEDLSKGMSQKIQFIAAVLHKPQLIILDEPFSGFDPVNADLIKQHIMQLRDEGCTIIFSTHRMESVEEMCDKVVMLNQSKKILDATRSELRREFKSNCYFLIHEQPIEALCQQHQFELIDSQKNREGRFESNIVLAASQQPNDLLGALIASTQIHHFSEQVPSMNDIFINKVNQGAHHA